MPYFHVVFTLPPRIGAIAFQNKAVIYDLLLKASAETLLAIAADPKRLGVKIGFTSVLHTWGSAMTHHPHVHMIVPGGGLSPDGSKWISSSANFPLPVPVLARMFRGKMLAMLKTAHEAGRLQFFGDHAQLADKAAFKSWLEPLYDTKWHVHAKRPFAGPEQVLAYLARYTYRVAIGNSRLVAADEKGVTFRYKDYRIEGPDRYKTMTVAPGEFIRRFMLHVLPKGFHRIRNYGLLASSRTKADTIERARELIELATPPHSHLGRRSPMRRLPTPRRQTSRSIPARAAAVAWSSSRCSRPAAHRATDRPRCRPRSGSTRHDADRANLTRQCRSIVLLVQGRRR